jgi:hypothetical protein
MRGQLYVKGPTRPPTLVTIVTDGVQLVVIAMDSAVVARFVALLVIDKSFLEQLIGVVETSVVMSLVMLVKLNRPDHVNTSTFICSHIRKPC